MIWIFGRDDLLKMVLDTGTKGSCPILEAETDEVLNGDYNLNFTIPSDHADSFEFSAGDTAVIQKPDGNYVAFTITEIEDIKPEYVRRVTCKHAIIELADEIITRKAWYWSTSTTVANGLLSGTRWTLGNSDQAASKSNFTAVNKTVLAALADLLLTYRLEIGYRVTISGGAITGRIIDLYLARGTNKGRRFEWSQDITGIERIVNVEGVKTALIGIGADTGKPFKATTQTEQLKATTPNMLSFRDAVWKVSAPSNIFHYDIADPSDDMSKFTPVCSTNTANLVLDKGVYAGVAGSSNSSIKLTKSDKMAENLSVNTKNSPCNVDASTVYRFSVYVNSSIAGTGGQLNVLYYDADGLHISTGTKALSFSKGWARYDYSFTTPSNCTALAVEVKALAVTNKLVLWLDAFMMDIGPSLQAWVQGWQYSPRPFDKPAGQNYIADAAALAAWGRGVGTRHRWGFYINNSQTDPDLLLQETYNALQVLKNPSISYTISVIDLSKALTDNFHNTQLGDPVTVIDDGMGVQLQSRVIEIKQDLLNADRTEIVLETLRGVSSSAPLISDQQQTKYPTLGGNANVIQQVQDTWGKINQVTDAGGVNTEWLTGVIDTLRNQISAGAGTVTMTDGQGILIEADPIGKTGGAMRLLGGIFALAPAGSWNGSDYNWSAFGNGDGFTADKINAGTLNATQVRIQMQRGDFWIDGDGIHHPNFSILSNGNANFSGSITGGTITGAQIQSTNNVNIGPPTDNNTKRLYFSSGAVISSGGIPPWMTISTDSLTITDQSNIYIGGSGTTITCRGHWDFSGATVTGI